MLSILRIAEFYMGHDLAITFCQKIEHASVLTKHRLSYVLIGFTVQQEVNICVDGIWYLWVDLKIRNNPSYFFSNVIKTIYLIKTKLGLQIILQLATKDGFESKRESVINFIQNVCPSKSLLSDVVTSALLYNFCCSLKTHFLSKNHSVEWKFLQQILILHLNISFHQKNPFHQIYPSI